MVPSITTSICTVVVAELMRTIFADTGYWIALANPKDDLHDRSMEITRGLGTFNIITTDDVLTEFMNFFCEHGEQMRGLAVETVRSIHRSAIVPPQSREMLNRGIVLYEARLDKGYSLTDCISMETMRSRNLVEVLTPDHHFTQEGFQILIR